MAQSFASSASSAMEIDRSGTVSSASLSSASASAPQVPGSVSSPLSRNSLRICVVCASNLNRSMEAHAILHNHGYTVASYGTGSKVRLPGETAYTPNVYDWRTPYKAIIGDLRSKNEARYKRNGVLAMLERDAIIKEAPQRFQDEAEHFDIVICFERRIFDAVCAELTERSARAASQPLPGASSASTSSNATGGGSDGSGSGSGSSVPLSLDVLRACHVLNLETVDNHAEALNGAVNALKLVQAIYSAKDGDWEAEIDAILDQFERERDKEMLHTIIYY
jgi:RNA polymerase II subunit A C-terminal domain phosphatase SSU72